jgi:hypothetical protein
VATVSFCALLRARPEVPLSAPWIERALASHWPAFSLVAEAEHGWSVGTVVGTETLVQTRPVSRGLDAGFVEDLLRAPSLCTLGLFASGDDAPAGPSGGRVTRTGVTRFQRWVCATDLVLPAPPEASELRASIRAKIPDFVLRSIDASRDEEAFCGAALGCLHRAGALGSAYAPSDTIRAALAEMLDALPSPSILSIFDGRTLALVHRGGRLLALEPAEELEDRRRSRGAPPERRRNALLLTAGPQAGDLQGERLPDGILTISPYHPWEIRGGEAHSPRV